MCSFEQANTFPQTNNKEDNFDQTLLNSWKTDTRTTEWLKKKVENTLNQAYKIDTSK